MLVQLVPHSAIQRSQLFVSPVMLRNGTLEVLSAEREEGLRLRCVTFYPSWGFEFCSAR